MSVLHYMPLGQRMTAQEICEASGLSPKVVGKQLKKMVEGCLLTLHREGDACLYESSQLPLGFSHDGPGTTPETSSQASAGA